MTPRFSLRAFLLAVAGCGIGLAVATAWNGRPAERSIEFSELLYRVNRQQFHEKLTERLSAHGLTLVDPNDQKTIPFHGTMDRSERIGVEPISFRGISADKEPFLFEVWVYGSPNQPEVFSACGVLTYREPYLRSARKAALNDAFRKSGELQRQVEISKWEAIEPAQAATP
jgi:hypothetical protein